MKTELAPKKMGFIRSAIVRALGYPTQLSLTDPDGWQGQRHESPSGEVVTVDGMLKLAAVWSCVRLISETIATLPFSVYERTAKGKRVAQRHPLQMLIHDQPNYDTTASVHWEAVVAAMLLRGCAQVEKQTVGDQLVGLNFLAPTRLTTSKDSKGNKVYRYTEDNGSQREIPAARVWTIPGFSLDGKTGLSVVRYATNIIGNAASADKTAGGVFRAGLKPTRFLKLAAWLTKDQREQYKESLDSVKNSLDRGQVPVLEGGMDFGTIGMKPDEAQLLESRAYSVEEICRWFRVPPWMVGHAEKSTSWGTGIEQQMIGFLTFTLGPWLKRLEQAVQKDLLKPGERSQFYVKFSVEGLLRADSAGRAAFYAAMVNNGILTRDEVRELEDREPMGGNAAVLTVQTAMAPLDSLGKSDTQDVRALLKSVLFHPDPATAD